MKHTRDHAVYGMKQTIKQRTVFEKEFAKIFVDCENTMSVCDINQLKGHTGSAFHGIFIATGRAETAVTAEGNKSEFSAFRAAIHCITERWITAVNHKRNSSKKKP
ncbi:hypothetical protein ASU35_14630 [Acetivibrio ethanolgignens]|uniref:Uncharacterized protein n=1 Tax=Acetivibrio ethanolgignens TaxID=290052 RepID=A0A0V8QBJ2_9FIRM|nr:hypothetical protein ASU35_14630 [Acetivibrio ethanolgignens]